MDLKEYGELSSVLEGWSIKELRTAVQVNQFLRDNKMSFEDIERFVDFTYFMTETGNDLASIVLYLRMKIWIDMAKTCPECGEKMSIYGVNDSPQTMIDKHPELKHTWMCPNEESCGFQYFGKKPLKHYWDKVTAILKYRYGNKSIQELLDENPRGLRGDLGGHTVSYTRDFSFVKKRECGGCKGLPVQEGK